MKPLEEYLAFVQAHPDLFVNPSQGGISVLLTEPEIRQAEAEMEQKLTAYGLPGEWAQVGIAYQDQYLFLLRDAVRFPDGSLGTYIRFVAPEEETPGVIILPVYQGQIVLLNHFRHSTRRWHLEIPRGFGAEGLSGEENARRELEEEVGATISRLVSLGPVFPDTGMIAGYNEFFFAEITAYGEPETHEGIGEIILVSVATFEEMLREHKVTDGFTLAAYGCAKAASLL